MGSDAWILLLLFLLVLGLLAWPLGQLLARLIEGELPRPLQRLERLCLGAATEEMDWRRYTLAILVFNLLGGALLFVLLLLQGLLPLNPQSSASAWTVGRSGSQHRHQLYDQYQLAGLCR
jgi:K+-transporting ATPase ATPase A chain